jgi:hypothetical protein
MFGFLHSWLAQRRRKRAAVAAAIHHFEETSGKRAHTGSVIGEKAGHFVVRVYFGNIKPPGRAWFIVGTDGTVLRELSFEVAQEFGEREDYLR